MSGLAQNAADKRSAAIPGTREALMLAALDEFARRGIAGTSINRLVQRSGAKNSSALHYHFGSKSGLVEALIKFVQDWFDEAREPGIAELERCLAQGQAIELDLVLAQFISPYKLLIENEAWGLSAIRFITMIEFDEDPVEWTAMYQRTSAAAERIRRLVAATTPHLTEEECRKRLTFFVDSVIYGFASYRHLKVSFFGDQEASLKALAEFYLHTGKRLLS